jgi:hypothetical protein
MIFVWLTQRNPSMIPNREWLLMRTLRTFINSKPMITAITQCVGGKTHPFADSRRRIRLLPGRLRAPLNIDRFSAMAFIRSSCRPCR